MFMVGVLPALLVLYIRRNVPESPGWSKKSEAERGGTLAVLRSHWKLGIYAIVLMTGVQLLQPRHPGRLSDLPAGRAQVLAAHGRHHCRGLQHRGDLRRHPSSVRCRKLTAERRCIIIASALALPVIPLWALSSGPVMLAIGAFLMQFMVQGAWGVIPVHLNELSPDTARGTFSGSWCINWEICWHRSTPPCQAGIATYYGGNYGIALAMVAGVTRGGDLRPDRSRRRSQRRRLFARAGQTAAARSVKSSIAGLKQAIAPHAPSV